VKLKGATEPLQATLTGGLPIHCEWKEVCLPDQNNHASFRSKSFRKLSAL